MTATDSPFDDATAATARGALITVTFNSAATLEHFWAAWQPSQDWEWIVVDNASTDTTVETARRLGARVIELPTNRGFSFANNVGYASTTADFIGFVNPDVAVTPESLGTLGETASLLGAIVGPQLLNGDGSRQPNGRGLPTLAAKIRNRIAAPDDRYLLFSPDGSPRPVYWLMGAAVFGHRAQLDAIGAWDPHFFLYYEDSDLGLRSWQAGIPVLLVPEASAVHGWARETAGGFRLTPWIREIASMVKFYARYPSLLGGHARATKRFPDVHRAVFPSNRERDLA